MDSLVQNPPPCLRMIDQTGVVWMSQPQAPPGKNSEQRILREIRNPSRGLTTPYSVLSPVTHSGGLQVRPVGLITKSHATSVPVQNGIFSEACDTVVEHRSVRLVLRSCHVPYQTQKPMQPRIYWPSRRLQRPSRTCARLVSCASHYDLQA